MRAEGEGQADRLSEVSRLAGALADQILRESMTGEPSEAKVTALGKAALLLDDFSQPIPDLVADVLMRVHGGGENGAEALSEPEDLETEGASAEGMAGAPSVRPGLFPRLLRSLRPPQRG
ncbi:hypothetical protein [Methylobacterium organophilum]|uniref:Uncharacterized protein n=1 Tax=Methylobacterium organophilum TaxID=410 RepID=A0ABQ4T8E4_METOR|nr:hypothetical protein [Methylobacterium organophilum]GJE27296.1 hypothetical protein LKMONMHP_2154 [Methylobacterium organophilum]